MCSLRELNTLEIENLGFTSALMLNFSDFASKGYTSPLFIRFIKTSCNEAPGW